MKKAMSSAEKKAKWEEKEKKKKTVMRVACLVISLAMILALFSTIVYSIAAL